MHEIKLQDLHREREPQVSRRRALLSIAAMSAVPASASAAEGKPERMQRLISELRDDTDYDRAEYLRRLEVAAILEDMHPESCVPTRRAAKDILADELALGMYAD